MSKMLPFCVGAGLIALTVLPASAALSTADRDFVTKAASGGMAEVQSAQLADQHSTSPQIKQFAQTCGQRVEGGAGGRSHSPSWKVTR